eukprot:194819_1
MATGQKKSDVEEKIDTLTLPPDKTVQDIITEGNKEKIRQGIIHVLALASVTVLCVALAHTKLEPENIIGYGFLVVYGTYLAHIWYLLSKAKYIHRIYTLSAIPQDWIPMSIAIGNKNYMKHPITSISEFSAIGGGVAKSVLARVGTITWGALMTLITVKISIHGDLKFGSGYGLQCIGAFGIDMIGTFYDDPYSKGMKIGHYTGVILAICCLVGFWIQRIDENEHIWLPVVMTVLFIIFFALFQFYDKCKPLSDNPTAKEITKRSRLVIGFETIGLGMLSLSLCLYFIMY